MKKRITRKVQQKIAREIENCRRWKGWFDASERRVGHWLAASGDNDRHAFLNHFGAATEHQPVDRISMTEMLRRLEITVSAAPREPK